MRSLRFVFVAVGIPQLILAVGFFFQLSWALPLWPVPETPLSYAFIATILGGGAAPLIWIGISEKLEHCHAMG